MKKNTIPLNRGFISSILIIFVLISLLTGCLYGRNKPDMVINGIETFSVPMGDGDSYLLFYPADIRIGRKDTIVREVGTSGEVKKETLVRDKELRRIRIHQKPTDMNTLYFSLFGEATLDNYYYTFDVKGKQFHKATLDYMDHIVGVAHIQHYGEDVLFQTIASHKTGDQNYDPETMSFQMSVSNFTKQQSFETDYGKVPRSLPLLEFGDKIIYSTAGYYTKEAVYQNHGLAVVDIQVQEAQYITPMPYSEIITLYASNDYFYCMDSYGKVYRYDRDLKYQTYHPFTSSDGNSKYFFQTYYDESAPPLFVEKDKALWLVWEVDDGPTLGLMTFDEEPRFHVLKKHYMEKYVDYRFLYQDSVEKEIYLIGSSENKGEALLVLDNQNYDLLYEIPIRNSYQLDFVVKTRK